MDVTQYDIRVSYRFPVYFTTGIFDPSNSLLAEFIRTASTSLPADALFVLDDGVAAAHPRCAERITQYGEHYADTIRLAGPVLVVPGGEEIKNSVRHLDVIHRAIHNGALCRHSYVVAVGGGAVLDAAGYAAATAHRGIRLIRVPTTVLAQDDSAVGVKNGINGFGKKNYFGTFAPPAAVISDFAFLTTLLDRDWLGGVSEAVKAALIKDAGFFDFLEAHAANLVARDSQAIEQTIRRSAALHLQHIAQGGDPFETGSSRPLDFGHWAAHRLEQLTNHRLRHGEAVSIGVALDATYSYLSGFLPERDWRRILDLLLGLRLPVHAPELGEHLDDRQHARSIFRGLSEFREHLGGQLTIMLLSAIGEPFDVHEVHADVMIKSIEILKAADKGRASAVMPERVLSAGRGEDRYE